MLDCSRCRWAEPETCRVCQAEQKEERLEQRIHEVVGELAKTRQVVLEPVETDWELLLKAHKN